MAYADVTWRDKVKVTENPAGTLTRDSGSGWGCAISKEYFDGDGAIKFTSLDANHNIAIGLVHVPWYMVGSAYSGISIEWAFKWASSTSMQIHENNSYVVYNAGLPSVGTVWEFIRTGSTLKSYRDGVQKYDHGLITSGRLFAMVSMYSTGDQVAGVQMDGISGAEDGRIFPPLPVYRQGLVRASSY